ncbi:hypothetical protein [Candidatus Poriferisocius sp.]|uniref:hypothetical protein n=1 Tax=Candidatus Poriferisocius sp. TaxID=3101276 RepID=UPI003B02023D
MKLLRSLFGLLFPRPAARSIPLNDRLATYPYCPRCGCLTNWPSGDCPRCEGDLTHDDLGTRT